MKVSALIKELERAMEQHGDQEVFMIESDRNYIGNDIIHYHTTIENVEFRRFLIFNKNVPSKFDGENVITLMR